MKPNIFEWSCSWKQAALRLGEELHVIGPRGYYDFTSDQWLRWARKEIKRLQRIDRKKHLH